MDGHPSGLRERVHMTPEYSALRKHARLTLREPVTGAITSSHEVHVLDLSRGGARLEHGIILRPGSTCYIRMPLDERVLTVNCQVIWSRAVGRAPGSSGGTGLLFQTGVQFGTLTREAQAMLEAYLASQGR
jgi:hypothetical protein